MSSSTSSLEATQYKSATLYEEDVLPCFKTNLDRFPLTISLDSPDVPKTQLVGFRDGDWPLYRLGWLIWREDLLEILDEYKSAKLSDDANMVSFFRASLSRAWKRKGLDTKTGCPRPPTVGMLPEESQTWFLVHVDIGPCKIQANQEWVDVVRPLVIDATREILHLSPHDEPLWYRLGAED